MECSSEVMLALIDLERRMGEADTHLDHYRNEMMLKGIILSTKTLTATMEQK
jgi:hypothetical protein